MVNSRLNNNQLIALQRYLKFDYINYSVDWDGYVAIARISGVAGGLHRCPANARTILKLARIV